MRGMRCVALAVMLMATMATRDRVAGQASLASVTGVVADATGAVIPGVSV